MQEASESSRMCQVWGSNNKGCRGVYYGIVLVLLFTPWLAPATIHQLVKRTNWDMVIKTAAPPCRSGRKSTPTVTGHRMMSCDDIILHEYAALVPLFAVVCTPIVPPFPQGTHSLMQNPHRTTLIAPHTHFFGSLRVCVCVGLETISAATSTLFFSFVVFFCKHKKLNLHN